MGARIRLDPRPARVRAPLLAAAMLGHCPGPARAERIGRAARQEIRAAGFGEALERALAAATAGLLEHLPVPLYSSAEFDDIFPEARTRPTGYRSRLGGDRAWLAQAVTDYFANGGEKLWVIPVPEVERQAGFLPAAGTRLHDTRSLRGLAVALVLEEVAVLALPDLERLQVPAELPFPPPRVRLDNPQPAFLPCGEEFDDGHRERSRAEELGPAPPAPLATAELLESLAESLRRFRPDMMCLFSLPPAYAGALGRPALDPAAVAAVESLKSADAGPGLRHLQLLFPYLRGEALPLASAAGAIAGRQAGVARAHGPWRSVAGRGLVTSAKPYPPVSRQQSVRLRERPGLGVLEWRNGAVCLDDERLAMPVLHPADYAGDARRARFDGYRAGEVARFLGFLMRRLRALGEGLVFNGDYRDPRPRYLLEDLFRRLYAEGALRGRSPESAYRIRQRQPQEGAVVFEIELAPAFPIDRVRLSFTNHDGEWSARLAGPGQVDGATRPRPATATESRSRGAADG